MKKCDDDRLVLLMLPEILKLLETKLTPQIESRLKEGVSELKCKVSTVIEAINKSLVYCVTRPLSYDSKALEVLDGSGREIIKKVRANLVNLEQWTVENLTKVIHEFAKKSNTGLGKIAQPLRLSLCGAMPATGIFEVMKVLGKEETLGRLDDIL